MNAKERLIIYIDGSNLYFKLKKLQISNTSKFNYRGLCDFLAKNQILDSINYYVGALQKEPNNSKGDKIRYGQNTLFNNLNKQKILLHKGYLMKNNGVYHEKGVDVNIAVDLLVGAYENKYDIALLISSDTDLIPAILKIKSLGKKLQYIGFKHAPSTALKNYATFFRLLTKKELQPFIKK
ncbi:MAG TPA: NYN domain-containing protein [bacterium]|nr:NYN domain-containing protein [bacterium]